MHSRKRERSVVEAWRRHSPGGSSRGAILQALAAREIAPARAGPSGAAAWGSLACFGVESEFDMHDPEALRLFRLPQLRRRSKVIEIVCSDDVVVALTLSGVACAFKDGRRVAFLNVTPDEMVRSVLFNRRSASFVTVSTYRADHFSSLHCRSTLVEWVRRGEPEAGLPIFQQEELRWPGFVEFDEVSCRAVTFSAADRTYGIWELANFSLLFRLRDPEIAEVKAAARNALLVVHRRKADAMRVQVLSIADGTSLLGSESPVAAGQLQAPSSTLHLYERNLFLAVSGRALAVFSLQGDRLLGMDHTLWCDGESAMSNLYVTTAQDFLADVTALSFSEARSELYVGSRKGSLFVWSLFGVAAGDSREAKPAWPLDEGATPHSPTPSPPHSPPTFP
ncbi:hypothetical protein EMIHUDRAFT_453439 [Emiliania huxleyi CCMP1516]|uniref:Uncharacterized protein n=2 Tax=Emiliania huxleyi TaxID=2903 RepID=A0A0D3I5N6_EMIH1|nr:hypothetical protein EMIHUDRAFT_453439 [Emiliania huxleyi CCMP1516]EOD06571.1 hypothetical protein EMIHUDRAFT_453439 [Emiliania huxleyi CCMP1516]|eukprot:XP_005759000.1 hypothetical protein EMIHUDRAFT_453439 [Emiliania huxleyi CCMP1516]